MTYPHPAEHFLLKTSGDATTRAGHAMTPQPPTPRSIDTSIILFLVLAAFAVGGVYCTFHFGNAREVERAFIILRERPDDPQPRYSGSPLIPATDRTSAETAPAKKQTRPEAN